MSSVSGTIGSYVNGYLFAELGYYGSFGFALACFLLGFVIVFFTVQNKKEPETKEAKVKLLDYKNVLESFKVLSKPRAENMRHIVIILVICFQIAMFSGGTYHINYLYVRKTFDWTDENTLVRLDWSRSNEINMKFFRSSFILSWVLTNQESAFSVF